MKQAPLEKLISSELFFGFWKFAEAAVADVWEKPSIPSWAGFNAILYPDMPIVSNIGYCPMIDGSSNDFSTIYTVLKHAQKISAAMGQADAVITFDLAIYSKAMAKVHFQSQG